MASFVKNLDTPLVRLGPHSVLTLRDFFNAISTLGGIGSGKTSAVGKILAAAMLRAGFGLLVLVAKPEEIPLWLRYAKINGRAGSLVIFDETRRFNPLDWLIAKYGMRGLGSITDCLMRIMESVDLAAGGLGGVSQEAFWRDSARAHIGNAVPLIFAAQGRVTIPNIVDFVVSAASDAKQYVEPAFAQRSYAARVLRKAVDNPLVPLSKDALDAYLAYWFRTFIASSDRTRANTQASLSTKLGRFTQPGRLRDIFCSDRTDIVPEMVFGGGIILMNMPILTWGEDGAVAQHLFKYCFMRAAEGRNALEPRHRERPIGLFADELQHFISLQDNEFLSTCRSARCAVLGMSQNLPAYYAKLGENRTHSVNGLLGKFNTHIWTLNSCPVTNEWAAKLIGRGVQQRGNRSRSTGTNNSQGMSDGRNLSEGQSEAGLFWNRNLSRNSGLADNSNINVGRGTNESESVGSSEIMDYIVEPNVFATALKSGGPRNGYIVSGLLFKAGASFKESGGANTILVNFKQR